ncbi:MAG: 50S ribosomal protein L6 [Patescibacteria group bacterium]
MSRIGKQTIELPERVTVKTDGQRMVVAGPLGQLERELPAEFELALAPGQVKLVPRRPTTEPYPLWGTYAAHLKNMIRGVATGFEKRLMVEGVGYKAVVAGNTLTLSVGFSHPVPINIPDGLKVTADKGLLVVTGLNRELVGQFAATLRAVRPPDPYKDKGIRYLDEVLVKKQGKKVVS